jgi:hypothetical protein
LIMWVGWDYISEQRAYCSSPCWYLSTENHGDMMTPEEEHSWVVHRSSLAIIPVDSPGSI